MQSAQLKRRDFITTLGGVAVWPLATRAQQPAMPVIGFLNGGSPDLFANLVRAFRQGLKDTGYVEGQNLAIEYRWAEGKNDKLPTLAVDLVRRRVALIAATTTPAALAAKAATATIPIVFFVAGDPVELGLVASLNRPGGNITGTTTLTLEVGPKRLELLHQMVPAAANIALLVNPTSPNLAEAQLRDSRMAARAFGLQMHVLHASTERDFDTVFASLVELRVGGLVISSDSFFLSRGEQLAALAARHSVPAIFPFRENVVAGGLMSYGGSLADSHRLAGSYASRILKGEKPADLPVQQSTKVELIINVKTAKALGLIVPDKLLVAADELIEIKCWFAAPARGRSCAGFRTPAALISPRAAAAGGLAASFLT
jgi:putative ABC transport system substrate-binding protein